MQARLERLEAVQDAILAISRISASGNDISGFLREVHQIIGRIMYAANFYVALYDASDNTIRFVYEVDEVDAPLDDSNTNRFCELVKSMSKQTQFLFISHNKITMEMAQRLIGVTMQEQGVSRIVTVDLAAAIKMGKYEKQSVI